MPTAYPCTERLKMAAKRRLRESESIKVTCLLSSMEWYRSALCDGAMRGSVTDTIANSLNKFCGNDRQCV